MIVYNVTVNVHHEILNEWLLWMKDTHLPEVMATQMFERYYMFKLLSRQDDEMGETYVIQYYAESMDKYNRYQQEFAPALQAKTGNLFGDSIVAFRTIMELI